MPNLPFTLRQLDVFASLCATGSFRRTAEELGISQASVSNQIRTLEEQLGVVLFDRKPGRQPILRPEGLAFLDDFREFERAAATLAGHRRKAGEAAARPVRFKVLLGQGMFDMYIRPKLDRFYGANPEIELQLETQLPYGVMYDALRNEAFDFALVNQRSDRTVHPAFRHLATVRGGIYGHRRFAEGKALPLTPEEVNRLPFIMPQASSRQERDVLRSYERSGVRPATVVGHTPFFDVMAAMLERGLGVASFSDAILPVSMRDEVISLLPLESFLLLFYRKESAPDPQRDAMEQFLISSLLDDPSYPAAMIADRGADGHRPG